MNTSDERHIHTWTHKKKKTRYDRITIKELHESSIFLSSYKLEYKIML